MNEADVYLRKAETWAESARGASTPADREACLRVAESFRSLAATCARLAAERAAEAASAPDQDPGQAGDPTRCR